MAPVIDKAIVPVILSGGSGQRLWPISRELYPKQLINLISEHSLLQETAKRLNSAPFAAPVIVCNDGHRFIVAQQLREIGISPQAIVLEPHRRNTAPACAVAALMLVRDNPDAMMLLLPSDHVISDEDAFRDAINAGLTAAKDGKLVTFGIVPDHPATGYGYIKKGAPLDGGGKCYAIGHFAEKPDAATAEQYVVGGDYFWNAGMFLFAAARYLEILQSLRPAMADACRKAVDGGSDDLDFFRIDNDAFAACEAESIDYAVMEHTDEGAMVPVDMGWSDVGSWAALWNINKKDANGNVLTGDVLADDVKGSFIHADGPLVAALGLEDVVIVATGDVVLALPKDRVEDIKSLVDALKDRGRAEVLTHPKVHRPWGWYETLRMGNRFQAKHLMVKPGHGISLQAHKKRAEHWVVVEGTARITRDDEVITLEVDQSTYIPVGAKHRLENPGDEPLSVIEVQSGDYLGEDDIVRFEDKYGRD